MSRDIYQKYELVVGLEVHVQLSTETKIFSSDSAAFGGSPNTHTSIVSLGLPGTLPRLNERVVEYAVKMGIATNCRINNYNRFDRKNYFYADLPKGYQITQDEFPICQAGEIVLNIKGQQARSIRINRIHMEEDAGKSIHDLDSYCSLVDLNRAGVPLIEIVSEPDMRSAEEAAAYFSALRDIARYLGICDGNLEEGSMRCDANISVRLKGESSFGNRCEVKNLNSVRNLQKAINFEFRRQVDIIEQGGVISQNTLNFDPASGETSVLRSKEMAYDYRYFPEPDLPPVYLTDSRIAQIAATLPELPAKKRSRYVEEYSITDTAAILIAADKDVASYFETLLTYTSQTKAASNWIIGPVMAWLNDSGKSISKFPVTPKRLAELIEAVAAGKLSYTAASQTLFPALLVNPDDSVEALIESNDLSINTDLNELKELLKGILERFPEKVKEYNKGKKGVLGMFMGELMKLSKGKIDPREANKILIELLNEQK